MAENLYEQALGQNDKTNEEQQKNGNVYLIHPVPLDDEIFQKLIKEDIVLNYPEFLEALAEEEKINPETDRKKLLDLAYEERVRDIEEKSVQTALDERTGEAYDMLQQVCFFSAEDLQYIQTVEGEDADATMYAYVKKRLENVEALRPAINFIDAVNEAEVYLISDLPNFNGYKASVLVEKMERAGRDLIDDEAQGMVDFISSKLYRKVNAQNLPYKQDDSPDKIEEDYLQRVLSKSSDYRLISYCQTRLPSNGNPKPVIRAYQRALKKTKDKKDSYKINMALAELYLGRSQVIGFATSTSDNVRFMEKGLHYLTGAYRFADKNSRLDVLKKMAATHARLNHREEWKNLKEVIAMKFLDKEDRCEALMAIGDKTKDAVFYHKAVEQCQKARMPRGSKLIVLDKAYGKIASLLPEGEERDVYLHKQAEIRDEKKKFLFKRILGKNDRSL